jgi:hypothetical protein
MKISPVTREHCYNIYRNSRLIFLSSSITAIWLCLWSLYRVQIFTAFGLKIGGPTNELGTSLVMIMPILIYGSVYKIITEKAIAKNNKIKAAVQTLNAKMFLEERDRRIHHTMHITMFLISLAVISYMALFPYPTKQIGFYAIGIGTFLASFSFFQTTELDNSFKGVSRVRPDKIPKGWMTMDIHDIIKGNVESYENGKYTSAKKE